jgi:hypothetical protein
MIWFMTAVARLCHQSDCSIALDIGAGLTGLGILSGICDWDGSNARRERLSYSAIGLRESTRAGGSPARSPLPPDSAIEIDESQKTLSARRACRVRVGSLCSSDGRRGIAVMRQSIAFRRQQVLAISAHAGASRGGVGRSSSHSTIPPLSMFQASPLRKAAR